jgi:hypothetical protein
VLTQPQLGMQTACMLMGLYARTAAPLQLPLPFWSSRKPAQQTACIHAAVAVHMKYNTVWQ